MSDMLDAEEMGWARRDVGEPRLVDEALAGELVERARAEGVELLGEGGLLKAMTKAVLERALAEEFIEHLGYEPGDLAGHASGNSRNGSTPKRPATEAGHIDLDVPRDRDSSFAPQTVRKGQRRRDGVDKLVIGLYAPADDRHDGARHRPPAQGDLRSRPVPRPDLQDQRRGARGGPRVAGPPPRRGLPGDLPAGFGPTRSWARSAMPAA